MSAFSAGSSVAENMPQFTQLVLDKSYCTAYWIESFATINSSLVFVTHRVACAFSLYASAWSLNTSCAGRPCALAACA